MKSNKNLQYFNITQYSTGLLVSPNHFKTQLRQNLFIESNGTIRHIKSKDQVQGEITRSLIASQLLGIFHGAETNYLVIVEDCSQVAEILDNMYFQIDSVKFVPVLQEYDKKVHKAEAKLISEMEELLSVGFYFMLGGDISLSLQKQTMGAQPEPLFIWNCHMMRCLQEFHLEAEWITPITQGFVKQVITQVNSWQFVLILISRRSRNQAGTRFNCRGLDDNGNVANFVETEQIVSFKGQVFSSVIVRGSIPAFWVQKGKVIDVMAPVKVTRSVQLTSSAFLKHFQKLTDYYGEVCCVNLIGDQEKLSKTFCELLEYNKSIVYDCFDLYAECKGNKWHKINPKITRLDAYCKGFGFFHYDTVKKESDHTQKGVFRVNCIDCIDRTNLYMSRLAFHLMTISIGHFEENVQSLLQCESGDIIRLLDDSKLELITNFKSIWAENGDQLSQLYSGTDATTSGLTKDGKTTVMGFLQHQKASIKRLYHSQFSDATKQKTITTLLEGMSSSSKSELDIYMESSTSRFCNFSKVNVYVMSWNAGACNPDLDLGYQLLQFGEISPDIVIIGLQEMVPLNLIEVTKPIIDDSEQRKKAWDSILSTSLSKQGTYLQMQTQTLVGLYLTVFVKDQQKSRISKVHFEYIKTGFAGTVGNKGAVISRFFMDDSEIVIYNCHLAAGSDSKARNGRIDDIREIQSKAFQKAQLNVQDADFKFFFGDLNMRVNAPYELIIGMINDYTRLLNDGKSKEASLQLAKILEMDELIKLRNNTDDILTNFQEGQITFLPTYKFDVGCDHYDTSTKHRTPSWCDRILISCHESFVVKFQKYTSLVNVKASDHRPVAAVFGIDVKTVDMKKYQEVKEEFHLSDRVQVKQVQSLQADETPSKKSTTQKFVDGFKGIFK